MEADISTTVETFSTPVADFFKEKSILITGATGFIGKVLAEKLLRSCSQTKTIYLLLRPKKGQEPKQRLEELFKTKIFERAEKEQPGCISKLFPIHGDLTLPGLGISASDQTLLINNVSIVFHSAASVNFDEPLKQSINKNVLGTQRLLELCHKMVHLEALIHVSTAFCHCNRDQIDEVVYDYPLRTQKIIDAIQWMDEDMVSTITPHLLKGRPNTYTYTKTLAETLLLEESEGLPVAIVRPSIVTAAWKEPFPGWVDNFNGPSGITAASGKGLMHSMPGRLSNAADFIPVDVVSNLMIVVAWYTATNRSGRPLVYNCCSGNTNRITWGKFVRLGNYYVQRYPNRDMFFYPNFNFTDSRLLNQLRVFLYHLLPAYALDLTAMITGRKPQLVSMYRTLHKAVHCLEYFTTHEYSFSSHNMQMLLETITPEDKQVFNFDIKALNWPTYVENYILGIRQFLLKDDLSSIPVARRNLKRKYILKKAAHLALLFLLWKLVVMTFKGKKSLVPFVSIAVKLFRK